MGEVPSDAVVNGKRALRDHPAGRQPREELEGTGQQQRVGSAAGDVRMLLGEMERDVE